MARFLASDWTNVPSVHRPLGFCNETYRALHVRDNGKPQDELFGGSVSRSFKRLAERAGLPQTIVSGLSGHSARVGAAQDMAAAGIDIIVIMHVGG